MNAKGFEFGIELLFPKVGVLESDGFNAPNDLDRPETSALFSRGSGFGVQSFHSAAALFSQTLPPEERPSGDGERIEGGPKPMLRPKSEDFSPVFCRVCNHTVPAYGIFCDLPKAFYSVSDPSDPHRFEGSEECNMYVSFCTELRIIRYTALPCTSYHSCCSVRNLL